MNFSSSLISHFRVGILSILGWMMLCGFALFAENGSFYRWNVSNGDSVALILNPVGCDCPLSEDEVLTAFRNAIDTWNNVQGSYFQFIELSDVQPEAFTADPTLSEKTPTLEDTYNVIGFSSDVGSAFAGFTINHYEGHFIDETDIFMGKNVASTIEEMESIVVHELGHSLGLGHDHTDVRSIMSYGRDARATTLGSDDIIGVTTLYPKSGRGPKPDLGCSTFTDVQNPPSFWDKALWNFLGWVVLLGFWSSQRKKWRIPQRSPRVNTAFSALIGVSLGMIACADSDSSLPLFSSDISPKSLSSSSPLFESNRMIFYCPKGK